MVDRFEHSLLATRNIKEDENEVNRRKASLSDVSRDDLERFYVNKREHEKQLQEIKDGINTKYISKEEHNQAIMNLLLQAQQYADKVVDSCMRLNALRTEWEGRGIKIVNVADGEQLNDVSTINQTCTFDSTVMNFKCGNKYFNLVENSANEPLVYSTTDSRGDQILAAFGSDKVEVVPSYTLKWNKNKQTVTDISNKEVVWNERDKHFQYVGSRLDPLEYSEDEEETERKRH